MSRHDIEKLASIADDPKDLEEIGRQILRKAIENEVAERLGRDIAEPMIVRRVEPGERVPPDLIGTPGLQVDTQQRARAGWQKGWLNLIIWDRNYSKNTSASLEPAFGMTLRGRARRIEMENVLSPKEVEVVKKLKLLDLE